MIILFTLNMQEIIHIFLIFCGIISEFLGKVW